MALVPPSPSDLAVHMRASSMEEAGWSDATAEYELQHATDLLVEATSVSGEPTVASWPRNPRHARILKRGICALAHALLVQGEDKDKEYSIFSSERLGSYSWQRMVQQGGSSGVADFDAAVALLRSLDPEGDSWTTSEHVFTEPYATRARVGFPHYYGPEYGGVRDPA